MIRVWLHLVSEALWAGVFKLASYRDYSSPPGWDTQQAAGRDEATRRYHEDAAIRADIQARLRRDLGKDA